MFCCYALAVLGLTFADAGCGGALSDDECDAWKVLYDFVAPKKPCIREAPCTTCREVVCIGQSITKLNFSNPHPWWVDDAPFRCANGSQLPLAVAPLAVAPQEFQPSRARFSEPLFVRFRNLKTLIFQSAPGLSSNTTLDLPPTLQLLDFSYNNFSGLITSYLRIEQLGACFFGSNSGSH
jgi:hypothetical protein